MSEAIYTGMFLGVTAFFFIVGFIGVLVATFFSIRVIAFILNGFSNNYTQRR